MGRRLEEHLGSEELPGQNRWICIAEVQFLKDSQGVHSFSACRGGMEIKAAHAVLGRCFR